MKPVEERFHDDRQDNDGMVALRASQLLQRRIEPRHCTKTRARKQPKNWDQSIDSSNT